MWKLRQHQLNIGKSQNKSFWKRRFAMLSRWLHIYLSMVSFAIVFFFAVTGLTLNHADKFGSQVRTKETKGKLNAGWVKVADTTKIDKLAVVEYLRNTHSIRVALADFRIDDEQCTASFKGPGYAADVFINRDDGAYTIQETSAGFVGVINDLHKGRDAGPVWGIFIDIAAVLMTLVSLTGMILILYMKKKRTAGLVVAVIGMLVAYLVYVFGIK